MSLNAPQLEQIAAAGDAFRYQVLISGNLSWNFDKRKVGVFSFVTFNVKDVLNPSDKIPTIA